MTNDKIVDWIESYWNDKTSIILFYLSWSWSSKLEQPKQQEYSKWTEENL